MFVWFVAGMRDVVLCLVHGCCMLLFVYWRCVSPRCFILFVVRVACVAVGFFVVLCLLYVCCMFAVFLFVCCGVLS